MSPVLDHLLLLADARSAVALGLADDSVPEEQLAARTSGLAASVAGQPPAAIRAAKLAVAAALAPQRTAAAANPRPAVARTDFDRSVAAFLGRRSAAAAVPGA
ncbi:hypothetical protein [Streptomyces sp. NPDC054765]